MTVFNRRVLRLHRDRAALRPGDGDFLFREVAERLADRLDDVKRRFPVALDLGCRDGLLGRMLDGRGGIERLVRCDLSPRMAGQAGPLALAADEEFLPFAEASFDLVLGNLTLHWVNDLPGALVQIRRILKPDGLFLASLLGGETLKELRQAFLAAEMAEEGGAGPRVSPFADLKDAGNLLVRAGFAGAVADADRLTVSYGDPFRLMADLRAMGESNAVLERRIGFTRRATLAGAAARYAEDFGGADGRLPATFEVLFLTGWSPIAP
ncbi:MAG: methyltransferase domain-containing protein [Magnetospirillum sp. WYHS-4]